MFRIPLARLASIVAVALSTDLASAGGSTGIGSLPIDPIIAQSGVIDGVWLETAEGVAGLQGTLLDAGGLILYDLVAQATPFDDAHGALVGEVLPRIHTLVAPEEQLLLYGQYIVSDETSGVFRAQVVKVSTSALAPVVVVGMVTGRYGRLKLIDEEPTGSAASVGGATQHGGASGLGGTTFGGKIDCPHSDAGASGLGGTVFGGKIDCPHSAGTNLGNSKPHGGATLVEEETLGGKIVCPYAAAKRMRAFLATQPTDPAQGGTKPWGTGMSQTQFVERLRAASASAKAGADPLGAPVPVAKYKGVFKATWTFDL